MERAEPEQSHWHLGRPYYLDHRGKTAPPPEMSMDTRQSDAALSNVNGNRGVEPPPGIGIPQGLDLTLQQVQHLMHQQWGGILPTQIQHQMYALNGALVSTRNGTPAIRYHDRQSAEVAGGWSNPSSPSGSPAQISRLTPPSPMTAYSTTSTSGMDQRHPRPQVYRSQNTAGAGGNWAPLLPRPTAKRALTQLRQNSAHGDRLQGIAEARRLWERLGDANPRGPENPESGFPEEAIQYARMGREYIKISMGETTTKAWQFWRAVRLCAHPQWWGGRGHLWGLLRSETSLPRTAPKRRREE